MSQEWHDERECLRYGGRWRDGRCERPGVSPDAQQAVEIAAKRSRQAWMLTGRHAAYLLAEGRPQANSVGRVQFDGLLLLDRARRAREMAAAWSTAAEAWEDAERQANGGR